MIDFESFQKRRMVIVSNRLPFTVTETDGALEFAPSAGGLVSGMKSYLQRAGAETDGAPNYVWVGWPGIAPSSAELRDELQRRAAEHQAQPVMVDDDEMDRFYHGFCNSTIWPLFHYFPSYSTFNEDEWATYEHVNHLFAAAVLEVLQPDDLLWIHDYHLMLLPRLIRAKMPDVTIGFFLHIPFPAYELFRLLPHDWRRGVLEGLLGADLIGFHTYEYSQHFGRAVLRTLGHETNLSRIMADDRLVQADTFPMGIDFAKYSEAPQSAEVKREAKLLAGRLADDKVVLSIDRLDYSKGIINRLEGYQAFLRQHEKWREKVVLALVIIPSREGVNEYQATKTQIEELVGRINGEFGSITWTPILYQYRSVPFPALIALYAGSDAALITPLRDGMNLIAKEYVAARADDTGVLILSELTGAATELGEALLITPTSRQEIADALLAALEMSLKEQRRRMKPMRERLAAYTIVNWAEDFIAQLHAIKEAQVSIETHRLKARERAKLLTDYRAADRRLLFLDYDGTLVPFAPRPELATPSADLLKLLKRLASNPRNDVVLISGRDKSTLNVWFGKLDITVIAEHGAWIKRPDAAWDMSQQIVDDWKAQIRPLLQRYAQRLPGAIVEEKTLSLAWHYRQADAELGAGRAKELLDHLIAITGNLDVRVLQGKKVLEVRPTSVSKGAAVRAWVADDTPDFILALGDDWTDEDLFTALPADAYTIKVGSGSTSARFRVGSHKDVLALLQKMAEEKTDGE